MARIVGQLSRTAKFNIEFEIETACVYFLNLFVSSTVKPKKVEIISTGQYLEAAKVQQLQCKASGANPPAVVTWWMNNIQLKNVEIVVSCFVSRL